MVDADLELLERRRAPEAGGLKPGPRGGLDTRLEGPLLLEPEVLGDSARLLRRDLPRADVARGPRGRRPLRAGQPLALRLAAWCAVCTSRSERGRPSSCAAPGARSSTWSWTCDAARRRSGSGRPHELDDERMRQLYVPIGFAHGFCVTSEVADVVYKCSSYYDPAVERGSPTTIPRWGSSGRPRPDRVRARHATLRACRRSRTTCRSPLSHLGRAATSATRAPLGGAAAPQASQ